MTLANGREVLSIPGPTTIPDRVLSAMHRPAIDIYAGDLLDTTRDCLDGLKQVFDTQGHSYIYAANGHGAWEAALTNVLSRGDRILVLQSGRFAIGWGEMGHLLGLDVEILPQSWRRPVDPAALEERLRADRDHQIKAVLVVQVDTRLRRRQRHSRHPQGNRCHRASRLVHGRYHRLARDDALSHG